MDMPLLPAALPDSPAVRSTLDDLRLNIAKYEKMLAQTEATASRIRAELVVMRKFAAEMEKLRQNYGKATVGNVDDVIRVLSANRGKRMSATEIEKAAGSPLRVRYLVSRYSGKPAIHEGGEKRGKVYWID